MGQLMTPFSQLSEVRGFEVRKVIYCTYLVFSSIAESARARASKSDESERAAGMLNSMRDKNLWREPGENVMDV